MSPNHPLYKKTEAYANSYGLLKQALDELNEEVLRIKKRHMPFIKKYVDRLSSDHANLKTAIEAAPEFFVKPRTLNFFGIKIGFQKGRGGIAFEDAGRVVTLIKKHFPDQAEQLVVVKETPAKDVLAQLSAQDLKKLGCHIVDADDQVVIKSTLSDIEKMVETLLKEADDETA
jgi:hypothetical protein